MKVQDIPINQIDIGERRRTDLGDIAALAKGLKRVGLLNPIIVDHAERTGRFRLVAGERRLRAARSLRWQTIPATLRENLTDRALREIELEENENRKPLTAAERNKTFRAAKKELETAKKAGENSPHRAAKSKTNPKGSGRRAKYGKPKEEVAKDLGISKDTLERDEQHVELAERYPWLQSDAWRQADVLRFHKKLRRIPESEHGELCQFMERAAAPLEPRPDRVLEYVEIMGMKTAEERSEIYRLSHSGDERDQALARTRALHRPPMPDSRTAYIREAVVWLRKAVLPPYDHEPEADDFHSVITHLGEMYKAIRARYEELKQKEAEHVKDEFRRREAISA